MACSHLLWTSIAPPSSSSSSLSIRPISQAPTVFRWTFLSKQPGCNFNGRSRMQRFLAFANANAAQGKRSSGDDVVMVDPLEAKRLAAKQMQEIRAREKLKKRRQAEAINGALALIGLTAGLVVEGQIGKGILGQLAGYFAAFASLFGQ